MKYSIDPTPQASKPEAKNNNTELKKTPSSASQDSQRSDRRRESSSSARSVSSPNASRRSPKVSRESPQLPPGIYSDFSYIYYVLIQYCQTCSMTNASRFPQKTVTRS